MHVNIEVTLEPVKATVVEIAVPQEGALLSFRVRGNLSLVDYFGPKGKGADSIVAVQTLEGRVDIPVKDNIESIADDNIVLRVHEAGQSILQNITEGTRFIFAVARPKAD